MVDLLHCKITAKISCYLLPKVKWELEIRPWTASIEAIQLTKLTSTWKIE